MCSSDIEGLVAETVEATIPARGEGDGVVTTMGVENEGDPECGIELRSGTRGKMEPRSFVEWSAWESFPIP